MKDSILKNKLRDRTCASCRYRKIDSCFFDSKKVMKLLPKENTCENWKQSPIPLTEVHFKEQTINVGELHEQMKKDIDELRKASGIKQKNT